MSYGAATTPNIEDFDFAAIDTSGETAGLRRIGPWVLIPDHDRIARIGSDEHRDYQVRVRAKAAYRAIERTGDIHAAYAAAQRVLRQHLTDTGRRVEYSIGDGQYLTP